MRDAAAERTDRQVGLLITLGAFVTLGGRLPVVVDQWQSFALWWNAGGVLAAAVVLGSAAGALFLPFRLLRASWAAASALVFVLLLLTFPAYEDPGAPPLPWVWSLEPVTVSLLVLLLPPVAAVVAALLYPLSVAASGLVTTGTVPDDILAATPSHLSNVAFVVIFIGIRLRLTRLRRAEAEVRDAAEREARAQAEEESRGRFARLVHDEVLAALNAAMLFRGEPPEVLRDEARTAIAVLSRTPERVDGDVGGEEAAEQLRSTAVRAWDRVDVRTAVRDDRATLPRLAVTEVGYALAEAVRNARTHSGADSASVDVRIAADSLRVVVSDDGGGFDPARVSEERLGITRSIAERVAGIGGTAEIVSAPGQGTEVVITWTR